MSNADSDEIDDFDVDFDYSQFRLPVRRQRSVPLSSSSNAIKNDINNGISPTKIESSAEELLSGGQPGATDSETQLVESPNNRIMEIEVVDDPDEFGKTTQNIFIGVCAEEGRYYTDLTTYHGLRRIFVSSTWTSRLFWCVVVTTCLTFFMIFSGRLLLAYHQRVTFLMKRVYKTPSAFNEIQIDFCGGDKSLYCSSIHFNDKYECEEIEHCVRLFGFRFRYDPLGNQFISRKLRIRDGYGHERKSISIAMSVAGERKFWGFLNDAAFTTLSLAIRKRVWLTSAEGGRSCYLAWPEVEFLPPNIQILQAYSLSKCELVRVAFFILQQHRCVPLEYDSIFTDDIPRCDDDYAIPKLSKQDIRKIQGFECKVECHQTDITVAMDHHSLRNTGMDTTVKLMIDPLILEETETRKMGLIDILSLVGGGTSLFLGCSCVTLMEMFVFLFKSVVQLVSKECEEEGAIFGIEIPEKVMDSFSIVNGRKRAFQNAPLSRSLSSGHQRRRISIHFPRQKKFSIWTMSPRSRSTSIKSEDSIERDVIALQSSIAHRLDRPGPSIERSGSEGRSRAPSLKQLKENVTFNKASSHSIEMHVRNLPIRKRLSIDTTDEQKYLRRQSAVDIPDEELKEYFEQNGLEYPDRAPAPLRPVRRTITTSSIAPSECSSGGRSSFSVGRDVITIVQHPKDTRRRPSMAFTRRMPMNDF